MSRTVSAAAVALCAGLACAQTATMPPHATNFTGSTRGYYFTAPSDFRITGVHVLQGPTGTNTFMNWAIVRFDNNTPPPPFSAVTNAFTQLGVGFNENAANFTPVAIEIHAGEVIGIYGNTTAAAGTTTGTNSYTATLTQATTTIFGTVTNLNRSGMQFHLGSATSPQGMHDVWAEPASTAISRVEFNYEALGVTGACCKPDGSCQALTQATCTAQGGTYQGDGVPCGSVNCPQPPAGACCFPNGTCTDLSTFACAAQGGVWSGAGNLCAGVQCPQPGACCKFATCSILSAAQCTAQSGTYLGNGTACGGCPPVPPVAYNNCNISTGPTTLNGVAAPTGGVWSEVARDEVDPTSANTVAGFTATGGLRVADDFVVGAAGLNLVYLHVYGYTNGLTTPSITTATVRIWNGAPNAGGITLFGDTTTNRLAGGSNSFSDIYRTFNTVAAPTCGGAVTAPTTGRRLQHVYITINQFLPPGTYWVDFDFGGASFTPPSTQSDAIGRQCDPNNSNGLQLNAGVWGPLADTGQGCVLSTVNQDIYFELLGTGGGPGCYPNCDGSTVQPCLNVQDFGCFLNKFASNDTYANCDNSTIAPVLNVQDFGCFLNKFASGCSSC